MEMELLTDNFINSFISHGQELMLSAVASANHASQILNKFEKYFSVNGLKVSLIL